MIPVERGSFITSEVELAKEWKWGRTVVRNFLALLEQEGMIERVPNGRLWTKIIIVNYDKYQTEDDAEKQPSNTPAYAPEITLPQPTNNQPKTNENTTNEQPANISKNVKKENNGNKKDMYTPIYEHWNQQGIIKHRKLDESTKRKILQVLETHTEEEVKQSMTNYGLILESDKHFFKYKWTLKEFLYRGLDKFLYWDVCSENYDNKHDPDKPRAGFRKQTNTEQAAEAVKRFLERESDYD